MPAVMSRLWVQASSELLDRRKETRRSPACFFAMLLLGGTLQKLNCLLQLNVDLVSLDTFCHLAV